MPLDEFAPLLGRWHGEGDVPIEPPMRVTSDATIERLGEFVVFRSAGQPAMVPDTLSIIGPSANGEPHPMQYVDSRGVKRRYLRRGGEERFDATLFSRLVDD